jgi:hypothetical protein
MEEKYTEEYFQRMEKRVNKILSIFKPIKDKNFIGYKSIIGKEKYHDGPTVKITALFKEPFKGEHSDIANAQIKKL